jgi:hypothetical protein
MKISEMLAREDFYTILPKTLNKYADFLGISPESVTLADKGSKADLYVNEKLNAVIFDEPSQNVRHYLRTEYAVSGSLVRRLMVNAYLAAGLTMVRLLSQRGLVLNTTLPLNDVLIYPCNKKIRLFDFASGTVHTVLKEGFPDIYIKREIAFRKERDAFFVPKIIRAGDGCYSERIIHNGRPLARIQDVAFVEEKKKESLALLRSLMAKEERIGAKAYMEQLRARCLTMLTGKDIFQNRETVSAIFDKLQAGIEECKIGLVISHGDFQPGNIWIDAEGKVVIIDWETVKLRSPYYDYAALYCQLRNHGGLQNLCDRVRSNQHLSTIKNVSVETILRIILAEELEYQTEELLSFPDVMGIEFYNKNINELIEIEI